MASDTRERRLCTAAAELLAAESEIESLLGRCKEAVRENGEVAEAVERFQAMAGAHGAALRGYLAESGGRDASATADVGFAALLERDLAAHRPSVSAVLQAACALFSHAMLGYAKLQVMALRLYDPPLREIAPRHFRAWATAARQTSEILPAVVARELANDGLECQCICPMCGIGACGCVALATQTARSAWREEADGEPEIGFPLQPPRTGSQLALAGAKGGDRLLEVDGVPAGSIPDIQTTLRKHPLGEELLLRIRQGSEGAKEIRVKHVSDYPSG